MISKSANPQKSYSCISFLKISPNAGFKSQIFLMLTGNSICSNLFISSNKKLNSVCLNFIFFGKSVGIMQSVGINQWIFLLLLIESKYASNQMGQLPPKYGVMIIILFLMMFEISINSFKKIISSYII